MKANKRSVGVVLPILNLGTRMEVSGERHSLAALFHGRTSVPVNRLGGPHSRSGHFGEEKDLCALSS
jgi:hypothetical protein